MLVGLYARVSTRDKGQDTENQLIQLREYCNRVGWTIYKEYVDRKTAKNSDREQFILLFKDAHQHKFDLVLFWSLDRFSREGALETLQHLQKLTSYKVEWKSFTEQYLDSCGIFKDAVLAILATVAKQERIRMSERINAGLDVARSKGVRLGREKLDISYEQIMKLRGEGVSVRDMATRLKCDKNTIMNRLREGKENENI